MALKIEDAKKLAKKEQNALTYELNFATNRAKEFVQERKLKLEVKNDRLLDAK